MLHKLPALAGSFHDLTPLLRAIAKQEWMVGQMQRNPNFTTVGSEQIGDGACS